MLRKYSFKLYHILVLCVAFVTAKSQTIDSFAGEMSEVKEASYYDSASVFNAGQKLINKSTNDNAALIKAEVYIYYGNHFYYTRNIPRAKFYFEKALEQAEKCSSSHFIILSKIRLAYIQNETEDFKTIENQLITLVKEAQVNSDYENIAEILNMRAIFSERNGDPQTSAKLYLEGLNLAKSHKLEYYEATFHNNLGLLKLALRDPDNALIDFSEVIRISKKINNKRLLSHAQLNLSVVLIHQKNYKEAHELFAEVIAYASANHHPLELSSAYANLGNTYVQHKDFEKGLSYIDSAISVLKKYNFNYELIQAYLGKANVQLELNNYKETENALSEANSLIQKSKIKENLRDYYYLYYEMYNKKKDFKKALECHVLYTKAKEGEELKLNTKALEELQLKYNVQQKEIELEKEKTKSVLLEKSHQEEVFIRWIILGILFLIIFLISVIFYNRYYRGMRKQQEQFSRQLITNTEEERSRIAKDLHDDIGQSLSILKSKFTNKNEFQNSDIISKEIERVIDQTRQISRNLFPSYLEKIGLQRAIAGLAEGVQNNNHIECSYEVSVSSDKIPSETATHVYRIMQECLSNTIKHSKATALKIILQSISENEFELTYMDNGNWRNANLKDPGVGLLSIKERSKIINGQLDIGENDNKGFKLNLKFKI